MKRSIFLAAAISFVFISAISFADEMGGGEPGIALMWGEDGTGNTWMDGMNGTEFVMIGPDTFQLVAGTSEDPMQLVGCEIDMQMTYDPDPYVDAVFGVKNTLLVPQTFTFTYTAPVVPALAPPTLYGGTFSGSLSSLDGGSVSGVSGTPMYDGQINGVSYLPYYTAGESFSLAGFGSLGIPGFDQDTVLPGPAMMVNNISMVYTFTLSPGELASFNGRFEVIPEPATLALLGLGGLLLRKRK